MLIRFFFLFTLLLPASASAADEHCALAADLAARVAEELNLPPAPGCPTIHWVAFADHAPNGSPRSQAGRYDPGLDIIALARDLDLDDPYAQSVLLHELVHRAQIAAGHHHNLPCLALLEAEAYNAQARFLDQAGLAHAARSSRIFGALLSQCPDPYDER